MLQNAIHFSRHFVRKNVKNFLPVIFVKTNSLLFTVQKNIHTRIEFVRQAIIKNLIYAHKSNSYEIEFQFF